MIEKIRDKANILLPDHTVIKRNIYTYYVSNNSPCFIRYKNHTYLINSTGNRDYYKISNASLKTFSLNNPIKEIKEK